MRMQNYIRMYARTLYFPRVHSPHLGHFVFHPTPCAAQLEFHSRSECARVHVRELVLMNASVFCESTLCSHFCRPRSAESLDPVQWLSYAVLVVKITCIWHRVTMLALCFLGKSSFHPSPHLTSLSAEPSFFPRIILLYIDPGSPFTLQGPRSDVFPLSRRTMERKWQVRVIAV
jgi:hypothetical protein